MSMKDKSIRIDDWAGNLLFIGPYDDPQVDKVLDANRCSCDSGTTYEDVLHPSGIECSICEGSGYSGDFEVSWIDEQNEADDLNVYEYISY